MPRPSSFISSFDGSIMRRSRILGHRKFHRKFIATMLSMAAALVILDVAVGLVFPPPADPRTIPSALQAYFDYGRSVEGKLRRMVGADATKDAPIVEAGWLAHDC